MNTKKRWAIILAIILISIILSARPAWAEEYPRDTLFWIWSDCANPAHATLTWLSPRAEVLPFTAYFPGWLTVYDGEGGYSAVLTYYGASECPLWEGCVMYTWRARYPLPEKEYYLMAYVVNAAGEAFYAQPEIFRPGCVETRHYYFPLILR